MSCKKLTVCEKKYLAFALFHVYNQFSRFIIVYQFSVVNTYIFFFETEHIMDKAMTIYDISQEAGVSIATVSRVLNGSDKVSAKTRKKVMDIMEKYAYSPNTFARGLGLNSTKTIGILCADSSDMYLAKAVYYLEQMLRAQGYDSVMCCTGFDLQNKQKYTNLLLSKKVDSIILAGSSFVGKTEEENSYIREAAELHPVFILNADFVNPNVYCYLCDDFNAMSEAVGSLADDGHKNILYVYNSTSYSGTKKLNGYLNAMENRGLDPMSEFISYPSGSGECITAVVKAIEALVKGGHKIDAVLASDDSLAFGALKYAARHSLSIPKDFAVIGYNNSLLSACSEPELTSIDNRLEPLCKQMVGNLVELLKDNEIPRKTLFSGIMMNRGTT